MYNRYLSIQTFPFSIPADSGSGSGSGSGEVGGVDDASILSESDASDESESDENEDEEEPEEEEEEGNDETDDGDPEGDNEEEGDEEEEGEEGDEEVQDDEQEEEPDGEGARLSTYTDIKKEFPDFFKKFPDIRDALFRDEQYSNLFGSPKEAETIVSNSETFDRMSNDIVNDGNITHMLDQVFKQKPESLEKIAFSILPYLSNKHKDLFFEVASVPVKVLVRNIIGETAGKTDKESIWLHNSAMHIHKYLFKNTNVDGKLKGEEYTGSTAKNEESEEVKGLRARLSSIENEKNNVFLQEVDGRYVKSVTKQVMSALDKDERLSDWSKSKIVDEIIKDIKKQQDADPRFVSSMRNLFAQAKKANFSSELKSRIYNTALARASKLIPELRKKYVAEALGKKVRVSGEVKVNIKAKSEQRTFKPKKASKVTPNVQTRKPSSNPDLAILRG